MLRVPRFTAEGKGHPEAKPTHYIWMLRIKSSKFGIDLLVTKTHSECRLSIIICSYLWVARCCVWRIRRILTPVPELFKGTVQHVNNDINDISSEHTHEWTKILVNILSSEYAIIEAKATITKCLFYKHGLMLMPGYVCTSIKICEIRLPVHLQTLMMPRLKFENGYVISPHTLLGVYLCIHAGNKTNRY